jgi:hypothetical protein
MIVSSESWLGASGYNEGSGHRRISQDRHSGDSERTVLWCGALLPDAVSRDAGGTPICVTLEFG